MTKSKNILQRPPAEVKYADELARLKKRDNAPKPAGWQLSMPAVREFILGNQGDISQDNGSQGSGSQGKGDITTKLMCPPSMIERALVTLASQRALLLIGEPGTAKSMLSELLAAAVSGDSTLTVQGSAATSEDQIRYSWNYGILLNEGPCPQALVPSPVMRGMQFGQLVRFEEITRCPPEVQDGLLSILSERLLMVPELTGHTESSAQKATSKTAQKAAPTPDTVFAQAGFNIIATANTRDKGVNEMSAALKRRFAFETVFPIANLQDEMQLVSNQVGQLLAQQNIAAAPTPEVIETLVTLFRELRDGIKTDGKATEKLSSTLSTAEAVSVAHAVTLHGHFLRADNGKVEDILQAMIGAAIKDNNDDRQKLKRYIDHHIKPREGKQWQAIYQSRMHLLKD